jgi:uncharacterized phage protein (TIGR01671 family)
MREIKFRGKRIDNGEWVIGFLVISEAAFDKTQHCIIETNNHFSVSSTGSGNLCYTECFERVHKVFPESVGQFTGLLDKAGKEIYEGDIYHQGDENILYVVEWHDSGLIGKQNKSTSYAGISYWRNEIEVIGNIYQTPELLK